MLKEITHNKCNQHSLTAECTFGVHYIFQKMINDTNAFAWKISRHRNGRNHFMSFNEWNSVNLKADN